MSDTPMTDMEELERKLAEAEAKIDALMLEYCPREMSIEQIDRWIKNQKPAGQEVEATLDAARNEPATRKP